MNHSFPSQTVNIFWMQIYDLCLRLIAAHALYAAHHEGFGLIGGIMINCINYCIYLMCVSFICVVYNLFSIKRCFF